ncbi:glycine--tRNA ligase subunit beta [Syntrophomonas palmitatica]|uniref:glycine--tRNA ligase subunit beta n=1 Tax=Syntrophomonas palmitatica TaxID=402877 RepID=UPI000AC44F05|nr:glycine--tRNA ligase subunit beta [Syntrophomonas palmitatica]
MAKDLLLEIGVEELPSAYMEKAIDDLQNLAEKKLGEARLKYSSLQCYGTPRRLTLYVQGLDEKQADA